MAKLQQNYQGGSLYTYQILAPYTNIKKKHNRLTATYENILVNNTKILYTDNSIKKLKIPEVLYIKFRQPPINKINFEESDNILESLK